MGTGVTFRKNAEVPGNPGTPAPYVGLTLDRRGKNFPRCAHLLGEFAPIIVIFRLVSSKQKGPHPEERCSGEFTSPRVGVSCLGCFGRPLLLQTDPTNGCRQAFKEVNCWLIIKSLSL